MELTYTLIVYIGVAALAVLFIVTSFSRAKYSKGRRSANTEFVRNTPQYKGLVIRYELLKVLTVLCLVVSILAALFLVAKPISVKTTTTEVHNRDIMICLDVSTSLDGVNLELCEHLKDMVSELKGERFGISIFNGRSVLLVPLTNDYTFIQSTIQELEDSISASDDELYISDYGDYGYRFSGTISDVGSSFIGDGLVSALYSFPDLDTNPDRSRLIVFVTDNDLNGEPLVSITQAGELCASKEVKVFALAPEFIVEENIFASAIQSTGGAYFNTRDNRAMDDMLAEVKDTDVSSYFYSSRQVTDIPEAAIVLLVAVACVYSYGVWRLKL